MYKEDLVLNNLQRLLAIKPIQTKPTNTAFTVKYLLCV